MAHSVTAIIKVTDQCNLSCPYCYYYAGSAADLRKRKFADAEARLNKLAALISGSAHFNGARRVMIVLHGGEPLLIPRNVLEAFVARLRAHFGEALFISLQTNGVLMNDEWVDFFVRHQISASVSLDGPKAVHDINRPFANGAGSYDAAAAAIQRLQVAAKAKLTGHPGVLAVFSPAVSGDEYFDEIVEKLGVKTFDLLFPDDAYATPDRLASVIESYATASDAIWRRWLKKDDPSIKIRFIQKALHAVARNRPMNNPEVERAVVIDLNGDMFIEDGLRASVDYQALRLGNWQETPFDAVMDVVDATARRNASTPLGCENCPDFTRCRGGDITERLQLPDGKTGRPPLCAVFRRGFVNAERVLERVGAVAREAAPLLEPIS